MTLLAGGSTLAMSCLRGVFPVRLCLDRLAFGSVLRFGFCRGVFLMSGIAHGRGSVGFVRAV